MGYMAYSVAEAFRTDALIDHVRGTLGERHAQELLPGLPDTSPSRSARILPGQTDTPLAPLLDQLAQVQSYLPVGQFHGRSEEHTSELQSRPHLVCRLLLEK